MRNRTRPNRFLLGQPTYESVIMKTVITSSGLLIGTVRSLSIIWLLLNSVVFVASQPIVSFSQRTLTGGHDGEDQMQGWEFVPHVDLTVSQLGLYDGRTTGGFQEQHSVAIWDVDRNLVTSANFPLGESAQLIGSFRYVNIPMIQLHAGVSYVIGAFMPGPVTDYTVLWERSALSNGIVSMDPRVEFLAYRAGLSPGSISFPESRWEDYVGAFGPNFIVQVPEPSTHMVLCTAVAVYVLSTVQKRRSRNAA
jgi:hypothetical protein